MIVDSILKYLGSDRLPNKLNAEVIEKVKTLAGYSFERQFLKKEERVGKFGGSQVGNCVRKLGYIHHNFEKRGKAIDSRANMNFFFGDMTELTLLLLAQLSGLDIKNIGKDQLTLKLKSGLNEIDVHPDGDLYMDGDRINIEVKSMSSFGYDKFERGDIDKEYIYQAHAQMMAKRVSETVFIALNKNNGVFSEQVIQLDEKVAVDIYKRLETVFKSTKDNLPEAEHKPDEKGFYDWRCVYCPYWGLCHTNAELVLVRNSYKLREKSKQGA